MSVKIITGTQENCPHLTEDVRAAIWESTPPYLRDAKTKGIPVLGAGLIYPISEDEIRVPDRAIPATWPRGYGMDVGWNRTAVAWFAQNPESKVLYIYDSYYQGERLPIVHADAIKARGVWIPGVIDPRSDGRSQDDGKKLFDTYRALGLNLSKADNSVTTGIISMWQLLSTGMLKVFASVQPFWEEIRIYRRTADENESGKIVKKNDHFLDACRYFVMSGIPRMIVQSSLTTSNSLVELLLGRNGVRRSGQLSWMSS